MTELKYMLNWIKMNSININENEMNEIEIIELFSMLPAPRVTYAKWIEKLSLVFGAEENEEDQKVETKIDPFERLKIEGKRLFDSGIVHFGESKKQPKKAE